MSPYADTNFLTRFYLGLGESSAMEFISSLTEIAQPFPVTWLHHVETCNAIQLYVFLTRAGAGPRITSEFAGAAWRQFCEDVAAGQLKSSELPSTDLIRGTEYLSLKYTARHGYRVYDLLHVASALLLGCDSFWSFDEKASRLARLEGLRLMAK